MKRKTLIICYVAILMSLTGCGNNSSAMYEVKQQPVVKVDEPKQGYGDIQAQVDPNADKDKELGTKHVVIIDGIPYAQLDDKETPIENKEIDTEQYNDNNTNEEKPSSAVENTSESSNLQDKINNLHQNSVEDDDILNKYADIINEYGFELIIAGNGDDVAKLLEDLGMPIDDSDKVARFAEATDLDRTSIYELAIYDTENLAIQGLTSNKRSFNQLKANIEVLNDNNYSYKVRISNDKSASIWDMRIIEYNGEYALSTVLYLDGDSETESIFDDINEKLIK